MRILNDKILAVEIDYQERLYPVMNDKETLLKKAVLLTEGLNALEVPVFATRQYPKGLGDTIEPIKTHLADAQVFDKTSFSILDDDAFRAALEAKAPETVILYGIETHICVAQSAIDLKEAGYQVYVVADASGSRFESDRLLGLERLRQEGVGLIGTEALLFELTRGAKDPHFKAISNLVK